MKRLVPILLVLPWTFLLIELDYAITGKKRKAQRKQLREARKRRVAA